jgi:hypothetical protein
MQSTHEGSFEMEKLRRSLEHAAAELEQKNKQLLDMEERLGQALGDAKEAETLRIEADRYVCVCVCVKLV